MESKRCDDRIQRTDSLESEETTASVSSTRAWQGELPDTKDESLYGNYRVSAKGCLDHEEKADSKDADFEESEDVKGSDLTIIEDCIDFCEGEEFQSILKDFKLRNCDKFMDLVEAKQPDSEEQRLEYTEIFNDYKALIDKELTEEFLKKNGYSGQIFYESCRDIVDGKFTALFEEHEHQWFVDVINGWLDYTVFVQQMTDLARAKISLRQMNSGNIRVRSRRR